MSSGRNIATLRPSSISGILWARADYGLAALESWTLLSNARKGPAVESWLDTARSSSGANQCETFCVTTCRSKR